MAKVSRVSDGEGRWQVRAGRESGCRLVLGKGEWDGKALWHWGSPEVTAMEEGPLGRGEVGNMSGSAQAVGRKGEKQRCCFLSHPLRLFLATGRSAWLAGCL